MLQPVLVEPGRIELREADVPAPGRGELLVRVDAALTCGTDVKMFRRGHPRISLPAPFGHEMAGTIVAVGKDVVALREGDALAGVPTAPCGECTACRRGRENLCALAIEEMRLGAFSPYVLLPERIVRRSVFARPAKMSATTAAALEPLACVVHGASRVPLADARSVLILGDGPIALLFVQVLRARSSARIALVGRHDVRLRVARSLGVEHVATESAESPGDPARSALEAVGAPDGADITIECVGSVATWERALTLTAPGGTALMFGGCAAGSYASFATYRIHYEEVDIRGAFHYTPGDVRGALDLLATGAVDVEPLITHRMPLSSLSEAIDLVVRREAIKVALCAE